MLQGDDLIEWIDGSDGGGAQRDDYCSDIVGFEKGFEDVDIHAAVVVGRNRDEGQVEDAGDTAVGVVGLIGGGDRFLGGVLSGDPEGFEVGEGSSTGEMAEVLRQAEHLCERGYGFNLHSGTGATAVERVIVGVERHRQRVGGAGDGMRRLQHLTSVERMAVGVVVVEAGRYLVEDGRRCFAERRFGVGWQMGEGFVQGALGFFEELEEFVERGLRHGSPDGVRTPNA